MGLRTVLCINYKTSNYILFTGTYIFWTEFFAGEFFRQGIILPGNYFEGIFSGNSFRGIFSRELFPGKFSRGELFR